MENFVYYYCKDNFAFQVWKAWNLTNSVPIGPLDTSLFDQI